MAATHPTSQIMRGNTEPTPIVVAPGDGIGPEITAATLAILEAAGASLDIRSIEIGESMYHRGHNSGIAPETWDHIRERKVILKGPITTPQGSGVKRDSGAAGCDSASASAASHGRAVNGLCTSPYSTCVGGTQSADTSNPSLYWSASTNSTDQSSALSYIPEVVWNESGANGGTALWASGGGASIHFAKPSWQTTPGVPNDGQRDVPDVSLSAATHDGYLVYSSDNATHTRTLYAFGGTSASAPSFAGIVALINQKTGYRQGNVNPTLYGLATQQANSGTPVYFHQITSGSNSVPGVTGFAASVGSPHYNQAIGLGSVDGNVLVTHWVDLLPASTTTLTVAPNPSGNGQSVTLSATVTGVSPTGTVQFTDGASNLGSPVSLSSGVATLTTSALVTGSHSITAVYSGDPNNQPSTSAVWVQNVLTATSVSLSASASSIAAGQAVSFTATVSGNMPTGTVQFKDGGTNLGTPIVVNATTATLNTNALVSVGNHGITAVYSGDAGNAASTSPAISESVIQAASSVAISSSFPTLAYGQSVTFTATVSGTVPGGSVQFTDGGSNLGAPVPLNSGIATLTSANLSVGSHGIAATYSGDTNNLGSTSLTITQTITSSTGDSDIPTLPQWATISLGLALLAMGYRQQQRKQGNG